MITGDIVVLRPAAQNVAPGVSLPAGPAGRPGDKGDKGDKGDPGASGVTPDISGKLDKSGGALTNGTVNATPVGQTTPAIGTFTRLGADGVASAAATDAAIAISNVYETPQGDFFTRTQIRRPGRGQHPATSISDLAVIHVADGSGANGPLASDQAATMAVLKKGYPLRTSGTGEIDVLNLFARQSGPTATSVTASSDLNVISGNYAIAGYPGFASWMEFRCLQQDADAPYAVNLDFGSHIGCIDPFAGNDPANRYAQPNLRAWGMDVVASQGAVDYGYFIEQSGGTFKEFLRFNYSGQNRYRMMGGAGGDAGTQVWGPDATKMTFGPDGSSNLIMKDAAGNLVAGFFQGAVAYLNALSTNSVSAAGLSVIDGNAHIRARIYTRQTLPTPSSTNLGAAQVSNPAAGKSEWVNNQAGTGWKYFDGTAVSLT